ncbi:hypothetical protein ABAZ39_16655 (plasmid) [Azospirillum argentinense]|uniref:Uncharacterized protein n=1 Tax=Azospirillum argentinense TaxID=2970906 RepID=A0A060DRH0_9PROT|nr:hypothetical protein [Azospirillum argentinense]AIB13569.1 hypothetical protein ABAZ39_16655 [Azospirillum argentinense]EZQ06125.1 hypothetical protein ABAZ39_21470 [Azospirillum argentinense]
MVWGQDSGRRAIEELLTAIEQQTGEAIALGARAQRDIQEDRFSSFLGFRRKVEEVRALVALTEERLTTVNTAKLADLRTEFERIDLLLTGLLARATRNYFERMRDDQALPIGARELFEPELKIIEEMRTKLDRPHYAGRVSATVIEDLEATGVMIRKVISRAPSLPDFSDSPTPPKPTKRLSNLGRPIRM